MNPTKYAELLEAWLKDRDTPCPVCGYNLRDLTIGICPECGQQFTLHIITDRLRFGYFLAFVAPMIGLFGGAMMFSGLILAGAARPSWTQSWGIPTMAFVGVLSGVATIIMYLDRRWFLVNPTRRKLVLIFLSWSCCVLTTVLSIRHGLP